MLGIDIICVKVAYGIFIFLVEFVKFEMYIDEVDVIAFLVQQADDVFVASWLHWLIHFLLFDAGT